MDGELRRNEIMKILQEEEHAISGSELAKRMGVSRQVIVQDIALLRARYQNILATNRGYLLYEEKRFPTYEKRTVKVKHDSRDIREELNLIVDAGARVLDVAVEHAIYGQITAPLIINNRKDVEDFVRKTTCNQTKPLTSLTEGVHFHTIVAEQEEILTEAERKLREAGFLLDS